MAKYILLSTLTERGRATLKKNPERIKEVNEELKELGVEVLKQWAVLGPYDFVNLVDAPDNEAIFKLSVEPPTTRRSSSSPWSLGAVAPSR
jgi:uncharacterized protein with GYD domain